MDKLTPEAVAKHAAAWPVRLVEHDVTPWSPNRVESQGLWRISKDGEFPCFAIVGLRGRDVVMSYAGQVWSPIRGLEGWTVTPVRPDGSDLPGAEYERGRADGHAEERAAIVAGLTARVEDMEGSITPHTQPESRRNLESQANELSNVIVLLKTGEWSAKP